MLKTTSMSALGAHAQGVETDRDARGRFWAIMEGTSLRLQLQ
jgi:hypothetical protein